MAATIGAVVRVQQAEKVLKQLAARQQDLRPVFMGPIRRNLRETFRQQFGTRGAHLGTPWPPLSLTTIRLRTRVVTKKGGARASTGKAGRARAGFATPMQDTRRAFRSFVNFVDPEGVRVYAPLRMEWGSRLPYMAPHHQPGGYMTRVFGKGPLRHVPGRPVIPPEWPAPIVNTWEGMMLKHILPKDRGGAGAS